MISFLKELWTFLKVRKKFWLLPILATMAILGGLVVLSQGSAVAPFLYTLFLGQYCSVSTPTRIVPGWRVTATLHDVHAELATAGGQPTAGTQWETTYLPLDAARDDAASAGAHALRAEFVEHEVARLSPARPPVLERGAQLLEGLALPEVEERGLDVVLVAEFGHRDLVSEVPPQDRGLLLSGELTALRAVPSVRLTHGLLRAPTTKCGRVGVTFQLRRDNRTHA